MKAAAMESADFSAVIFYMLTLIKKVKTLMTVIIKNTLNHETFNGKDICNVLGVIIINDDIRSRGIAC